MIAFFIFYFVFSAVFMAGVRGYGQDNIPFGECLICILLGWFLMPFGLGMLFVKINSGDLEIKKEEDE